MVYRSTPSSSFRNILEIINVPRTCFVLKRSFWTEHSSTPVNAAIMAVEITPILIKYCTAADTVIRWISKIIGFPQNRGRLIEWFLKGLWVAHSILLESVHPVEIILIVDVFLFEDTAKYWWHVVTWLLSVLLSECDASFSEPAPCCTPLPLPLLLSLPLPLP